LTLKNAKRNSERQQSVEKIEIWRIQKKYIKLKDDLNMSHNDMEKNVQNDIEI